MVDLKEAIRMTREAVKATPEVHLDQAKWLSNLGIPLVHRHSLNGSTSDLEEARQCFNVALNRQESPSSYRIAAGRRLLSSLDILQEGPRGYLNAKTTIQLMPLLAPSYLQNTDKQHLLSQGVGLASDAAAIALLVNKGPVLAIELLETGRGVLASSLQDMRTDLSSLQKRYPELARSFVKLRDQLDPPPSPTVPNQLWQS
uniref:WGS project CBMI000000000 data, contig CS3069_c003267 n=1 Tax=Fusarium clavum TaxID=2594811 RepID=A0A090N5W0_9HYPO|nr:unnamed protein product [Fusarium clavum]